MHSLTQNTWLFGKDWGQITLGMLPSKPVDVSSTPLSEASISLVTKITLAASALMHGISAVRCTTLRWVYKEAFFSCREREQWAFATAELNKAGIAGVVGFGLIAAALILTCRKVLNGSMSPSHSASSFRISPKKDTKIPIPDKVKTTLNELLPKAQKFDSLPILSQSDLFVGQFSAPIMKGLIEGRPFVAIRVERVDGIHEPFFAVHMTTSGERPRQVSIGDNDKMKTILLHQQYADSYADFAKKWWFQQDPKEGGPLFFTSNFTLPSDGSGPTDGQERGFGLLKTLLQIKLGQDINGVEWKLSEVHL